MTSHHGHIEGQGFDEALKEQPAGKSTGLLSASITTGALALALTLPAAGFASASSSKTQSAQKRDKQVCAGIYFDQPSADFTYGQLHAIFLQNLLAHFPKYDTILKPVEDYKKGDIESCAANFYVGSYYRDGASIKMPDHFVADFVATKKPAMWMGYNAWLIGEENSAKIWNMTYRGLTQLDLKTKDKKGDPGFYRFFNYKGNTWVKSGEWAGKDKTTFNAAHELLKFADVETAGDTSKRTIISDASHSTNKSKSNLPYIIRSNKSEGSAGNHWLVTDSPFAYIHEADRYFIVADVLFDVLGEEPRNKGPKHALFRIEDVNARTNYNGLKAITDVLEEEKVPYASAFIPVFSDPLGVKGKKTISLKFTEDKNIRDWVLSNVKANRLSIINHGTTHQFGRKRNPYNGMSGLDYEYWDMVGDKRLKNDTLRFVINRVERGVKTFAEAGITPVAFEVPHYRASARNYVVFGQYYNWNVGRVHYTTLKKLDIKSVASDNKIDLVGTANARERLQQVRKSKVSYVKNESHGGQLFPYELYGDYFGQRLIPESLNYPTTLLNTTKTVENGRTLDQMLEDAKRNLVLRDYWASFFMHAFLMNGGGEKEKAKVRWFVRSLKDLGYKFINLKEFVEANRDAPTRPIRAFDNK